MLELNKIYCMDCLEGMKQLESASVDLIVTDPPYGMRFMGKNWDKAVPSLAIWEECRRVLKPGAFMFVMCIPRLDCQFEMAKRLILARFDVGFTPIYWAYASGFPKAQNISKTVDRKLGAKREIVGDAPYTQPAKSGHHAGLTDEHIKFTENKERFLPKITKATSKEAKALDGSFGGHQPKPAIEIILVVMKPLSEKTYVDQALKNKKGVTWLDDGRIPYKESDVPKAGHRTADFHEATGRPELLRKNVKLESPFGWEATEGGRFPANLLVSDDVLDDGRIIKGEIGRANRTPKDEEVGLFKLKSVVTEKGFYDSGGFSRYFSLDAWWRERIKKLPKEVRKVFPFLIVPKASKSEKNKGLEGWGNLPQKPIGEHCLAYHNGVKRDDPPVKNFHPTTKPIKLMSYLITLGSREGDLVLDPFVGSGTTVIAARLLSRRSLGFEINKEYYNIAQARIKPFMVQRKLSEVF